jgi:hypothetical protein
MSVPDITKSLVHAIQSSTPGDSEGISSIKSTLIAAVQACAPEGEVSDHS